jgi:hypothetical protein
LPPLGRFYNGPLRPLRGCYVTDVVMESGGARFQPAAGETGTINSDGCAAS